MRTRRVLLGFSALAVSLTVGTPSASAADFPETPSTGNGCNAILGNPGTAPGGKSAHRSAVASVITTELVIDACFGG